MVSKNVFARNRALNIIAKKRINMSRSMHEIRTKKK